MAPWRWCCRMWSTAHPRMNPGELGRRQRRVDVPERSLVFRLPSGGHELGHRDAIERTGRLYSCSACYSSSCLVAIRPPGDRRASRSVPPETPDRVVRESGIGASGSKRPGASRWRALDGCGIGSSEVPGERCPRLAGYVARTDTIRCIPPFFPVGVSGLFSP
jgi:hypothetical protein